MAGFSRPRCERYIEKLRGLEASIINAEMQTNNTTPQITSDYCRNIILTMEEALVDQKVFAQAIWTYKATFDEALRKLGGDKASRNQGLQAMKEALHNLIHYAQNWLGTNAYALAQEEDFPAMSKGRALLDQVTQKVNENQNNTPPPPRVEELAKQPTAQANESAETRRLRELVSKLQGEKQALQTQLDTAKTKLQNVELKLRNLLESSQGTNNNRLNAEQQLRLKDEEILGLLTKLDKLMADKATLLGERDDAVKILNTQNSTLRQKEVIIGKLEQQIEEFKKQLVNFRVDIGDMGEFLKRLKQAASVFPPNLKRFAEQIENFAVLLNGTTNIEHINLDSVEQLFLKPPPDVGRLLSGNRQKEIQEEGLRGLIQICQLQAWGISELRNKMNVEVFYPTQKSKFDERLHKPDPNDDVWMSDADLHNCIADVKKPGFLHNGNVRQRAEVRRYIYDSQAAKKEVEGEAKPAVVQTEMPAYKPDPIPEEADIPATSREDVDTLNAEVIEPTVATPQAADKGGGELIHENHVAEGKTAEQDANPELDGDGNTAVSLPPPSDAEPKENLQNQGEEETTVLDEHEPPKPEPSSGMSLEEEMMQLSTRW